MFTGFNIDYPEYIVITPQTGLTYGVRYLNVSEVAKIKASISTPSKASEIINKVLYSALVTKPDGIKTYEDFLRVTTLRDREALMYGLYITTFGEDVEFEPKCRECEADQRLKFKISDMFEINAYPGSNAVKSSYKFTKIINKDTIPDPVMENVISQDTVGNVNISTPNKVTITKPTVEELMARKSQYIQNASKQVYDPSREVDPADSGIFLEKPEAGDAVAETSNVTGILNKYVDVTLPVSGVVAILRQPTMAHEKNIYDTIPMAQKKGLDLASETLIIERFDVYHPASKAPIKQYSDRMDILDAYQSLPNADKKFIFEKFKEIFGDYGITLKFPWVCRDCGADNEVNVDVTLQFFRMVALS